MGKVNEQSLDTRFALDQEIRNLLGGAFEDYGMRGIIYVVEEIERIFESLKAEDELGELKNVKP